MFVPDAPLESRLKPRGRRLLNAGQSCCAVERIYVHREIFPAFVDGFVALTRQYRLGNPLLRRQRGRWCGLARRRSSGIRSRKRSSRAPGPSSTRGNSGAGRGHTLHGAAVLWTSTTVCG